VLSYEPSIFSFGGEKKKMVQGEAPVYYSKRYLLGGGLFICLHFPRIQSSLEIFTNEYLDVNLPEKESPHMHTRLVSLSEEGAKAFLKRLEDESFVRKFERVLELYPIISANIVNKAVEDIDLLLKRREEAIAKKEAEEKVRRRHAETYWKLLDAWLGNYADKIMRIESGWVTVYGRNSEYYYIHYLTDDGELYEHRTKDIFRSQLAFAHLLEGRKIRSFRKKNLRQIPKDVARAFARLLRDEGKEELLVTLAL